MNADGPDAPETCCPAITQIRVDDLEQKNEPAARRRAGPRIDGRRPRGDLIAAIVLAPTRERTAAR